MTFLFLLNYEQSLAFVQNTITSVCVHCKELSGLTVVRCFILIVVVVLRVVLAVETRRQINPLRFFICFGATLTTCDRCVPVGLAAARKSNRDEEGRKDDGYASVLQSCESFLEQKNLSHELENSLRERPGL